MLGLTVVFALAVLGWMILQFGGEVARPFAPPTITVKFISDRADGVADGSSITFRGVDTGHVTKVRLLPDRPMVEFEGVVNRDPPLPANLIARIRAASALGSGSMVSLEMQGPDTGGKLQEGQTIKAEYIGFGQLLPLDAFGDLADELKFAVRDLRESKLIQHLDEQVRNAGKTIDSIQQVVGDPKTREDIKASIANLREITENAKALSTKLDKFADELQKTNVAANETIAKAGQNIESLSRQMGERLTQIARLLDSFQSISEKLDKGQGSAGALVNDPKLYESLVDTSRELNETIRDFKRLVEQWEQEGVTLKLK
jgi:phospholipid/cholesterol/gamma-HCH transport system substrate-binding protein